jgi:2-hydroxy-3-oxopropionate reductase
MNSELSPGQTRVGFIGLGLMGLPMARNLLKAGYRLTVFNRTAGKTKSLVQQGAKAASTADEVARESDVVITMVTDSPDVIEVVTGAQGLLAGARRGSIWIDTSTISPAVTRDLVRRCGEKEVRCLDAPVSGGPPGAAEGTLAMMVGGPQDVFDRCLPLLRCLGRNIVRVGENGAGQVTKACNQIVIAATLAGIAEAFAFGAKAGVDTALIRQALLGGYAASPLLEVHGKRMITHKFDPGFFVRLHRKDLHIVLEMARDLSAAVPVTGYVEQLFNALVADGEGERDNSSVARVYERLGQISVKSESIES